MRRPFSNKRPLGPFAQLTEDEKPEEGARYWVAAVFNKPRGEMLNDAQKRDLVSNALELNYQEGRGQAYYDGSGGPKTFKIYYRTIWMVTEEANTPVPAEDVIRASKKITSGLSLQNLEYDQSMIQCGRPDRVDQIIGPNVTRHYTRTEGPYE